MKLRLIGLVVWLGAAGSLSTAFGQQNAPPARPLGSDAGSTSPSGSAPFPTINLSGKDYYLLETEKYASFLSGMRAKAGGSGGASGGEESGSAGGSGGASAADAVDPSTPLAQFQFQNYFAPHTYDAHGYANTFILQPVIPIHLNSELFPYHIIRPTLPIFGGPEGVKGGVGDLTVVDVFVHPFEEIKTSAGAGYVLIAPTATDPDLGPREWYVGPSVFGITRAVPKWVIGALVEVPISVQSNAYQVQVQPIVNRLFEDDWYVGWGDTLLTLNDQSGHYNIPLQLRVGKVVKFGKQPVNIFVQGEFTPHGFQSGRQEQWAVKLSITPLLPGMKLGPICGGKVE